MRTLESLIDEASDLCGGDAQLARRIDVPRQNVNEWRHGKRPLSPETVGLLADVLQLGGEEARRLAVLAVIGNPKNKEKAGVLRRAFFVSSVVGALVLCGANDAQSAVIGTDSHRQTAETNLTVYTLWRVVRTIFGGIGRAYRRAIQTAMQTTRTRNAAQPATTQTAQPFGWSGVACRT